MFKKLAEIRIRIFLNFLSNVFNYIGKKDLSINTLPGVLILNEICIISFNESVSKFIIYFETFHHNFLKIFFYNIANVISNIAKVKSVDNVIVW